MLSEINNNLRVKLYSGVSIGVINILGSVIDFNVSSTLLIKSKIIETCSTEPILLGGELILPEHTQAQSHSMC